MSGGAAPFRFVALVVGGWACMRAAMLAPDWWMEAGEAASLKVGRGSLASAASEPVPAAVARFTHALPLRGRTGPRNPPVFAKRPAVGHSLLARIDVIPSPARAASPAFAPARPNATPLALAARSAPGRWSASAWLFVRRDEGGTALAPGGMLGGGQSGARLLYRLNRDSRQRLALSGRLYAPLRRRAGAEAALGLDWHPIARLPVNILAERRQALGEEGRSAFALTIYGGGGRRLPGGLRLDGYAQTGMVGLRSRDLFVDGAVRLSAPVGPVELGAGAWGAAQPGVSRLDAGPQISVRLPVEPTNLRLSAEWRFRLAGDAAPASGPALTLAADF